MYTYTIFVYICVYDCIYIQRGKVFTRWARASAQNMAKWLSSQVNPENVPMI
jgi:hypothetical protein